MGGSQRERERERERERGRERERERARESMDVQTATQCCWATSVPSVPPCRVGLSPAYGAAAPRVHFWLAFVQHRSWGWPCIPSCIAHPSMSALPITERQGSQSAALWPLICALWLKICPCVQAPNLDPLATDLCLAGFYPSSYTWALFWSVFVHMNLVFARLRPHGPGFCPSSTTRIRFLM